MFPEKKSLKNLMQISKQLSGKGGTSSMEKDFYELQQKYIQVLEQNALLRDEIDSITKKARAGNKKSANGS